MNADLHHIDETLTRLIDTLDGHDASAIIVATEALAANIARLPQTSSTPAQAAAQSATVTAILAKLTQASIRANMHRAWTRQRLDGVASVRGGAVAQFATKY
jgi:hypothetical protein